MIYALLLITALVGVTGLVNCPPRPRAQEFWGTIALVPLFLITLLALFNAQHSW